MDIGFPQSRQSIIAMDGEILRPRIRTIAEIAALTLRNDLTVFKNDAADEYWIPRLAKWNIGTLSRGTAGDQVITGIGFKPSLLLLFAIDSEITIRNMSWGFDDGTVHYCIAIIRDTVQVYQGIATSIYIMNAPTDKIEAYVSALSNDGFTLTWSLSGTRSAVVNYLCLP